MQVLGTLKDGLDAARTTLYACSVSLFAGKGHISLVFVLSHAVYLLRLKKIQ